MESRWRIRWNEDKRTEEKERKSCLLLRTLQIHYRLLSRRPTIRPKHWTQPLDSQTLDPTTGPNHSTANHSTQALDPPHIHIRTNFVVIRPRLSKLSFPFTVSDWNFFSISHLCYSEQKFLPYIIIPLMFITLKIFGVSTNYEALYKAS